MVPPKQSPSVALLASIAKRYSQSVLGGGGSSVGGEPISGRPRGVRRDGPRAYVRIGEGASGFVFRYNFVAYLAVCRRLAPSDVFTTADIALRELLRVANASSYWGAARPSSCADWSRRAQERDEALALVAAGIDAPLAFVAGQRFMALVTRLVRRATVAIDVVVPRLWPGTSRAIHEALEALSTGCRQARRACACPVCESWV